MKTTARLALGAALAASGLLAGCGEEDAAVAMAVPAAVPAPAPAPVAAPVAPAPAAAVLPAPAPAAPLADPYDPAKATGTIKFKATAKGTLPKMRPIKFDADPKCGEAHKDPVADQTLTVSEGKLANAIVWVSKGAEKWSYATPTEAVVIDQHACMYVPHVLTFMVNQPVTIKNSDEVMHNIHAMPEVNEEFNKSQLKGAADLSVKFGKEEVAVKIKCDVHGWMGAWAGVFSHPFHGVTGADGSISVKVPPGDYEVSGWHEFKKFGKPEAQKVTVAAGETKEVEFVFEAK